MAEATKDVSKANITQVQKDLDSDFQMEKEKLEKDYREKVQKLKEDIEAETEEEEAKLKEEQMTTLIRLRQKLKSELGEEEKKLRVDMHEKLSKTGVDIEEIKKQKMNNLNLEELKIQKEIAEEKSKMEEEKQVKLAALRSMHERDLEEVIEREKKTLENEKESALENFRSQQESEFQRNQKWSLMEEMAVSEKGGVLEEINSDKLRLLEKDHDRQVKEAKLRHEENIRRIREDFAEQTRREKDKLRTKMEYEQQLELNTLEDELRQKKDLLGRKYQTEMKELQNDLEMLNKRRANLQRQSEEIAKSTKETEIRMSLLRGQNRDHDLTPAGTPTRDKPSPRRATAAEADTRLNMRDLEHDIDDHERSVAQDSVASDISESLLQNFFAKKNSQREDEGLRNAREFLQRQQRASARRSVESKVWLDEMKRAEKRQTNHSKELLKKIERSLLLDADEEEANEEPFNYTAEGMSTARDRFMGGTHVSNGIDGTNNTMPQQPFMPQQQAVFPDQVLQYLQTVDDKLNKVLGMAYVNATTPQTAYAVAPTTAFSPVPQIQPSAFDGSNRTPFVWQQQAPRPVMPSYPSLRDTWHSSVSARVDEELKNVSKYFGYSFGDMPPASVPYRPARDLIRVSTPQSFSPNSTGPFQAWDVSTTYPKVKSPPQVGNIREWERVDPSFAAPASRNTRNGVQLVIDQATNELKAVPDNS